MKAGVSMMHLLLLSGMLLLTSCSYRERMMSAHLVDPQGFSQTIHQPQRLQEIAKIDFLSPQPYKKVLRTWDNKAGVRRSILTSYYPSGQPMQYLEGRLGRASGIYREWYDGGQLRVQVRVVGGELDFGPRAQHSWIFDETSYAYYPSGQIKAEITYRNGKRHGPYRLYGADGSLAQAGIYHEDQLEGLQQEWEGGQLHLEAHYQMGLLDGRMNRYHPDGSLASAEDYVKGLLQTATYWSQEGLELSKIEKGHGERLVFEEGRVRLRQRVQEGAVDGLIVAYNAQGRVEREYTLKNGFKDGIETIYYPYKTEKDAAILSNQGIAKLILSWQEGVLQGTIKSYFNTGALESQWQMVHGVKEGPYLCYYPDGSLRMVEHYHDNKLLRGDYFPLGQSSPVSEVRQGQGVATLYDEQGLLQQRIIYEEGAPGKEQERMGYPDCFKPIVHYQDKGSPWAGEP